MSEARQSGIAGAEVVHRDAKPHLAQPRNARLHVANVVQTCALRDLENNLIRHARKRALTIEELVVKQVVGVQVDEEDSVFWHSPRGCRRPRTNRAAQLGQAFESLRRVEDSAWVGKGRLTGPQQGFETEDLAT